MKKTHRLSILFMISILIIPAVMIACLQDLHTKTGYFNSEPSMDFSENWRISVNGEIIKPIKLPANLKLQPNDKITLEKTFPASIQRNMAICFRSTQQQVTVYLDGERIYSYGEDLPPFGFSPGSIWNIIRLNPLDAGKTITIELSSPCKQFAGCINTITIGTKSALLFHLWTEYSITLVSGLALIFTGLLMLLFLLFIRLYLHIPILSRSSLYLAIFAIITGGWIAIESRLLQFFIDDVFILHYLDFLTLAFAPVAMHLYLLHLKGYIGDSVVKALLVLGMLNGWLVFILHALNVLDVMDTVIGSHAMIISTVVYVSFSEIKSLLIHKRPHVSTANTLAFGVLVLGCIMDLLRFYLNPSSPIGTFVSLGFVGFMIVLTLQSFLEFYTIKSDADRTQLLRELAYMDSLTQLGNRTAYEEALEKYQRNINQIKKLAIFIADINGLKGINDMFGHSAGDTAISKSGVAIRNTFCEFGKAYRIGGDEFCVICEDITIDKCEHLCNEFKQEIEYANNCFSEDSNIPVYLSLGYAFYDNVEHKIFSIEELVRRADNAMYAQKLNKSNKSIPKLRRDTIEMRRIDH